MHHRIRSGIWTQRLWGRKVFEFQHIREEKDGHRHIGIHVGASFRANHAGPYCNLFLWRHLCLFQVYDGRHRCVEHGCWFDEMKHPFHEREVNAGREDHDDRTVDEIAKKLAVEMPEAKE